MNYRCFYYGKRFRTRGDVFRLHKEININHKGEMRMKKKITGLALTVFLTGCASSPDKMQASYVSPLQYKDYDCDQIAGELERASRRANELYGSLKKTSNTDNAQMAVGLILFWPALFFLEGGDGPEAAEYGRLKGERDALEKVAIQKKCDPAIIPKSAKPVKQEASDGDKQQSSSASGT